MMPEGRDTDMTSCGCPKVRGVQAHPANCPTVAWMGALARQLAPELGEMARLRRRAEDEARNTSLAGGWR